MPQNWSGLKVEQVPPESLKSHPMQKVHFTENDSPSYRSLKASMQRGGLQNALLGYKPPGATETVLLAGYRRQRASLELNWKEIDVKIMRKRMTEAEQELLILDNNISARMNERRFGRTAGDRLKRMDQLIKKIDPKGWRLMEQGHMSQKDLINRTGVSDKTARKIIAMNTNKGKRSRNEAHTRVYPNSIDQVVIRGTRRSMSILVKNIAGANKATKVAVLREIKKTVKVIKAV